MGENTNTEATVNASKFYHLVKSYNSFDKIEILGVLQSLLSTTDEENCFIGTYYRARANVETMLEITNAKHFQAVAMLARGMFELALDIKMLKVTPNAWIKISAFRDVEKLRCARKVVSFKNTHPDADIDTDIFKSFIDGNETRIKALSRSVWLKITDKQHWTGIRIAERVEQIGPPMDKIYEVDYPRLSWYVHSGLTGVLNIPAETFVYLCSYAFWLAAECYREILEVMISRFEIDKGIKNIDSKLFAAKAFPFNDDPDIEAWLMRSIQE